MLLEKRADLRNSDVVWLCTWAKMSVSSKPRVEVSGSIWVLKRPCWMLPRSFHHTGKSVVLIVPFLDDVNPFFVLTSLPYEHYLTTITEVCSCGICGDSAMSTSRPYKTATSYPRRDSRITHGKLTSESVQSNDQVCLRPSITNT
jgi:hypothetical protein